MSLQEKVIRAQVDQFERDGYLVVPDVLSSEKVDRLNAAIDEVLSGRRAQRSAQHLPLYRPPSRARFAD